METLMTHFYHGTFWSKVAHIDEAENAAFFDLDTSYSDLSVIFVTNSIETAYYFSNWNRTSDEDIQVVLRGELLAENLLVRSTQALQRDPMVEIDGEEYDVGNREEFFEAARRKYDGFNLEGNYQGGGDDIALFSGSHFNATEVKFLVDGKWTEWMEQAAARDFHLEICGLRDKSLTL